MADASYSPRLRTALVLTGAGTAGAYQAGVIRALADAGTKIDLIAAHGPGIANACIASVDGGQKLGDATGPWASPALLKSYRWRAGLRAAGWGISVALAALLLPLAVLVVAALIYAASLIASLLSLTTAAAWLVTAYRVTLDILFHPPILPTVVPRVMVLSLLVTAAVLVGAWFRSRRIKPSRRRSSGAFWWQLFGAPIDATEPSKTLVDAVWTMVRGAETGSAPTAAEIGRRYVDLVTDNFGQPGFREVVLGVHDLDARRDIALAVVPAGPATAFAERRPVGGAREAEAIDLSTSMRDYLADIVGAGLELPGATAGHSITFPADHYWPGETHRLTDRAEIVHRLVDEVLSLGAEQVILVSAAPPAGAPHALGPRPVDLRGRVGEWQRSVETAVIDDAIAHAATRFSAVFVIRPAHNPVGPFQFQGTYDEMSDRTRSLADLVRQGFDDANRLFVEPVLASGERVEAI
ncbi:MAG: hypothetical protein EPO35_01045 [Acidobacteria bacterium]|nr:MAG: hypothetical protein EPO35_01045 [Acidobacteriota bacterium]